MKKKHRSTAVLEEISVDIHHHLARFMANPRISIFSKKVIRTNAENSAEVGRTLRGRTHLILFIHIQSNS